MWLYNSKDQVLGLFQWLNLAVNLSALVSLAIYYGYDHSAETAGQLFGVVKFSFGFYVLHYLVRVLYHFHPKTFFRETWAEGLLMVLLAVEGAGDLFLAETQGRPHICCFSQLVALWSLLPMRLPEIQ